MHQDLNSIAQKASVAILVGGASSRFGADKGLYHPTTQPPVIVQQVMKFRPWFSETLIICHSEQQQSAYEEIFRKFNFDPFSIKYCIDEPGGPKASIAGIRTALRSAQYPWVMTIAVDQVAIGYEHLRPLTQNIALMNNLANKHPLVFNDPFAERALAFPSLWPLCALPAVNSAIDLGDLSINRLLSDIGAISFEAGRNIKTLKINANTEEEALRYFSSLPNSDFPRLI